MKKIFTITILIHFTSFFLTLTLAVALAQDFTESSRWNHLMGLITQEENAINKITKKSDDLLYRLFELKTEKIKLLKENENKNFLALKLKGKKIVRKKAFKKTLKLYHEVNKLGHSILKKYPRTQHRSSIYYTLALNSRDYAYDKKEEKYLKLAIKFHPRNSEIFYLAKTALAEYYYNAKKYSKAIRFYKELTQSTQDEWYTKNLYNYGWCLLKVKKFKEATHLLEKAYSLSKSGEYIDFREQALNSLVSFYVISNQIEQGKSFILKNEKNAFPYLFKLTQKVADKGSFNQTQKLILQLEKISNIEETSKLKTYQLSFYQKFKRYVLMLDTAKKMSALILTKEQRNEAINLLSHTVGLFQLTIKKDFSRYQKTYNKNKLASIQSFFEVLIQLDKTNKAKYEYFLAETLFSIQEFRKALFQYRKAFESYHKLNSDQDIRHKSIKAMMAVLERTNIKESYYNSMLEFTYQKHTTLWPKDKLTQKIYPKFYYFYMSLNRISEAKNVMQTYVKSFPKDLLVQQSLFRHLMDYYIKHQRGLDISNLLMLMDSGYLQFKDHEIAKAQRILANILFTKYQKLNKEGLYTEAIKGFKEVYFNNRYPQKIKADAAFNIGIVFTNQVQAANAIKWFNRSLNLLSVEEKLKKREYLKKLATRMYLLQDFLNSANLGRLILQEYCDSTPDQNYYTFEQTIRADLANDYVLKALHTYEKFPKCIQGSMAEIQKEIMQHLYLFDHEKTLLDFISTNSIKKHFPTITSHYLKKLFWKRYHNERNYLFLLKKLKDYTCEDCKKFISHVQKLNSFKNVLMKFPRKKIFIHKKFVVNEFNAQLEQRLLAFKKLSDQGIQLLKLQNPQISLIVIDHLAQLNSEMAQELNNLSPPGDKEFQKQFKGQMKLIANQFQQKASQYTRDSVEIMEGNEVFVHHFLSIQEGKKILNMADIRSPASETVVTFDLTRR